MSHPQHSEASFAWDGPFSPLHSPNWLSRWLEKGRYELTSMGLEKRCTRCKCLWPADTEFLYFDASSGDRLFCWCVACVMENKAERRERAMPATAKATP